MFKASPFKLNMFLQCPRQYKFHYIDGLKDIYKKPRAYFTMGETYEGLMGRFEFVEGYRRAYEAYQKAIESDPSGNEWTEKAKEKAGELEKQNLWVLRARKKLEELKG